MSDESELSRSTKRDEKTMSFPFGHPNFDLNHSFPSVFISSFSIFFHLFKRYVTLK